MRHDVGVADSCTGDRISFDTGADFIAAAAAGIFDLPLPGAGRTRARFRALRLLGRGDLSRARLAEGHADAQAIMAEASSSPPAGARLAVWAAGPIGDLLALRTPGGWRLQGIRRWCSGACVVSHALVTAAAPDGDRLFVVPTDAGGFLPDPSPWAAVGMAASGTVDVTFDDVELHADTVVGAPGFYLARPGFWVGAIGVAAVWLGGAESVASVLAERAGEEPHALAHLGAVHARLEILRGALDRAAVEVDRLLDAATGGANQQGVIERLELLARTVRAEIEAGATEILDRTGRATGAGPLAHDPAHARRVADLTVYLRQSHAERDLQALGSLARRLGATNLVRDA